MSYEMLMELVLTHLRERKGQFTIEQIEVADSDSINFNPKNGGSIGGGEETTNEEKLLNDVENIQNDLTKDEPS